MKIRELQERLSKFDPELEVICYNEDEIFLVENRGFVLFDIQDISTTETERFRLVDGTPYLEFKSGSTTEIFVTLDITSVF